jgi:hypothetical protein
MRYQMAPITLLRAFSWLEFRLREAILRLAAYIGTLLRAHRLDFTSTWRRTIMSGRVHELRLRALSSLGDLLIFPVYARPGPK